MLEADILKPSALGARERDRWDDMVRRDARLQRAFMTFSFASACEAAYGRVYVAVLHERGAIRGFLPFQFLSALHERLRSAVHVGERMSDAAGVIAEDGVSLTAADALRLTRSSQVYMTHLLEDQAVYGLTGEERVESFAIDLAAGGGAFLTGLRAADRKFVQDTDRCARKLEEAHGARTYARTDAPDAGSVDAIVERKRRQYAATGAADVFADGRRRDLIHALRESASPLCTPVLQTLTAGGDWAAGHFGLQCEGALSYWFPVYDDALRRYSPGRLLLWEMIARSDAEKVRVIDMGAGGGAAKERFANRKVRFGKAVWRGQGGRAAAARLMTAAAWRAARLAG